jgi:hypothetical protein
LTWHSIAVHGHGGLLAAGVLTYTRGNFAAIDSLSAGATKPTVLLRER